MSKILDPNEFAGALLFGGLFLLVGICLSWMVRRLISEAMRNDSSERVDERLSILGHLAVLTIWILLTTFYAHLVPALDRLGATLLTGVSLMSVIGGFAAQTTLGHLVSGISLAVNKPFKRGDRLQIQAPTGLEVGRVAHISLSYTVLTTDDQRQIIVPNGQMVHQTMVKLSSPAQVDRAPSRTESYEERGQRASA